MNYKLNVNPKKVFGKRVDLAQQESVTDQIVTTFTTQIDAEPPIPLSSTNRKKGAPGIAIAAAIFIFFPFVYPIAFFINGFLRNQPVPFLIYPFLVIAVRYTAFIGGLLLYLAARRTNAYRKPIGWSALGTVVFTIGSLFFLTNLYPYFDPSSISRGTGVAFLLLTIASLLCMLLLCIFCVLLLIRIFRKKPEKQEEAPIATE